MMYSAALNCITGRRAAKAVVLALAVAMVSLVVASSIAMAEDEGIQVLSQAVTSTFPDEVVFRVTASGPDPIDEVRVFLKPLGSDQTTYGYVDVEAGQQVSGQYVMNTAPGATHLPAGAVIRYFYEIRDTAGRVLRTDEQEYLYLDDSLEWKQMTDGQVTVHYYGAFLEKRARTLLETARETIVNMAPVLGIEEFGAPINMVAYNNYLDMARALPFRSQAVREDLQTQGQAWPAQRTVLVLVSGTTFTGIASHELTHILISDAAGRGYSVLPAWLNEGLAEFGNVDQDDTYDYNLAYGIYTRRVKPLWFLDQFGGEPNDIVIAYGQGKSVVEYLVGVYGPEKMADLMVAFHSATSVDEALLQAYGLDQYGLDSEWRGALGLEPFQAPDELAIQEDGTVASEEGGEDGAPDPTPLSQATPAAQEVATPQAAEAPEEPQHTARSCGAPPPGGASLPIDVAVLAMVAGPFLTLPFRLSFRRKWGGLGRWVRRLGRRNAPGSSRAP